MTKSPVEPAPVLVSGQRSNVLAPGRLKRFARVGFRLLGLWMLLALHAG